MNVTAVVLRSDFEGALEAAREVGRGDDVSGLAAPLGAALLGRVEEAWDAIESALAQAYARGAEVVNQTLSRTTTRTQELLDAAGAKAGELQDALLARLQRYVSDLLSRALDRVQPSITVGARTLSLASVELSQTVSLSGSLKANISEIMNMTAQGQLVVNARYADEA